VCPAGTALLILSTFFHRDDQTLPYANRFEPDIWLDGRTHDNWSLIPFNAGPGACPGRNLVLLIACDVAGKSPGTVGKTSRAEQEGRASLYAQSVRPAL
jgi:Cytochrome P450